MSNHLAPLEVARSYLRRGWMPLPVPYRSKNPGFSGWQNFTVTELDLPRHFNGQPQNVGILLGKASNDLADVDLDSVEAVFLAPHFLPTTGAVFGRETSPRSHWLFVASVQSKVTCTDPVTGKRLVEILTNGQQAIFPGSTHKDTGESVQWYEEGEPARVDAAGLLRAAKRLAAATLLARHWPTVGSRQDAALALAGGLLRAGWSEDETAHFIEAVCAAVGDEETSGRIKATGYTLRKLAAGARATGWPTLAKFIDQRIVSRVCEWLEIRGGTSNSQHNSTNGDGGAMPDDTPLCVVRMADVAPESVRWLWYPYIALGKLTLLEGDPGIGKSTLTCAIASAVSNGRGLPGTEPCEPGNVLMLSAEDGLADTLRPRLDAVGADTSRVFALNEPLTLDVPGLLRLEAAIIEYKPKLVIIDPLFAYTGGKTDIHRANECRAISAPLAAIAERQGCGSIAVRHLGKSRGGGHALNAGIGSIDFVAAARSVLLVGADPDEPARRAVVQTKNNLAPEGPAVGYKLEGGQFWWTGESDLTAGRILASVSDEEQRGAQAEAIEFLRAALTDSARPAKEVKAEAAQVGLTEQNLRTARMRLGIRPFKEGGEFGGKGAKWMWKLPDVQDVNSADQPPQDVSTNGNQHLVANHAHNATYGNDLAQDVSCDSTNVLCDDGGRHTEASGAAFEEDYLAADEPIEGYKRRYDERRAVVAGVLE